VSGSASTDAEPDPLAVDEKQIQLEDEQKVWLYAAIDINTKLLRVVIKRSIASTNSRIPHLREFKRVFAIPLLPELMLCTMEHDFRGTGTVIPLKSF